MKIMLRSIVFAGALMLSLSFNSFSQGTVYDVVSIGAGYGNQSFYSLENGEVSNVSNTDWDLAFQISGFQATILVNGKSNVKLFRSGLDINSWSTVTAADTVGALNSANELLNQDTSWWSGAFNITNDATNQFDLGWGVYDLATHAVVGDSLFFIQLSNGIVKKLWIQSLANSIYTFVYADLDGSNEVNTSLNKQSFAGKNFGYYSFTTGTTIDREPNKYTWDLSFAQYMSASPIVYKVSGVLANDSVAALKVYPVDPMLASPWGSTFSYHINTIGYLWKSYDFNSNSWAIEDSLVYFVSARNGNLWKVVFTGFAGASTGNYEFYKEQVSATGLIENGGQPALLHVAPNPASATASLTLFINRYNAANTLVVYDLSGRVVSQQAIPQQEGLFNVPLSLDGMANGTYVIKALVDGKIYIHKLVVLN
ncbi:MAG: T9SS type A sorting domain-containing protein [Bacteroidetes bacterium]|nr:T9SS type A sorting domain-containing protein [Bacteroidota bacterium]